MSGPAITSDELLEAWGDVVSSPDLDSGNDWSLPAAGRLHLMRHATTLTDRLDGRFLPIYQTEFDLAVIRALSRTLALMAPSLVGGLRNLCNYTIGEGYRFTATREPRGTITDYQAGRLLDSVQNEIEAFLDDNDFLSSFDREIHDCSVIDGETFLRLDADDTRVTLVRCEPDQIREPARTTDLEDWVQTHFDIPCHEFQSSWTFGVHSRLNSPALPLGYHLIADENGSEWDYIPAERMLHIRRNVTRNAKRGYSDFYPIEADSLRGEKLRRNMAEGAAIQSAIAFVRQHVAGVTRAGVETMIGENRSRESSGSVLNRPRHVVQYRPGTVVDLSAGLEYKPGPLGSERAQDFLLVAAYVQRMQAVRWSMPEYMFSGDASNANYASTMEATAPFVKACEAEQRFYSRHFINLLWKVLKLRWQHGAFDRLQLDWETIEQAVKISAECPEVATRDELRNVQRQEILIRLGLLSLKTAATQNGLDYEAEVANGARPQTPGGGPAAEGGAASEGGPTAESGPEGEGGPAAGGGTTATGLTESITPYTRWRSSSTPESRDAQDLKSCVTLIECGGKGGKPGPCPENRAKVPSRGRQRGRRPTAPVRQTQAARTLQHRRPLKSAADVLGPRRHGTPTNSQASRPHQPSLARTAAQQSTNQAKPQRPAGRSGKRPASQLSAINRSGQAGLPQSQLASATNPDQPVELEAITKRSRKGKSNSGKTAKPSAEPAAGSPPTSKTGRDKQRWAEEENESQVANAIGGNALKDNEPVDVLARFKIARNKSRHVAIELKSLLTTKNGRIKMSRAALFKKKAWADKNPHRECVTVAIDDRRVYAKYQTDMEVYRKTIPKPKRPPVPDYSLRDVYFRLGFGNFSLNQLHKLEGGLPELNRLMHSDWSQLPEKARERDWVPKTRSR